MVVKVSLRDAHKTIKEYENLGYLYVGIVRTIDGVTLSFRDPIVPEENNITDIQFHEGDYVENNEGKIGYISSIAIVMSVRSVDSLNQLLHILMEQQITLAIILLKLFRLIISRLELRNFQRKMN